MDHNTVGEWHERMKTWAEMEYGAEIERNLAEKLANIIAVLPNLEA
jgi:hypothetical protein